MSFVFSPAVDAAEDEAREKKQHGQYNGDGNPFWRRRNAIFRFVLSGRDIFTASQVVFGKQAFFTEAEVASDGANESAPKYTAGKPRPILVFKRFEETLADARGGRN